MLPAWSSDGWHWEKVRGELKARYCLPIAQQCLFSLPVQREGVRLGCRVKIAQQTVESKHPSNCLWLCELAEYRVPQAPPSGCATRGCPAWAAGGCGDLHTARPWAGLEDGPPGSSGLCAAGPEKPGGGLTRAQRSCAELPAVCPCSSGGRQGSCASPGTDGDQMNQGK